MEGLETVGSALLTLGLVAVAVALSIYQRLGLEKDIGIAVVRSFVQLAAMGYVIDYVFRLESLGAVVLLLAGMVGFCLSGDLFNMFVFFELMSVAAFALAGYKIDENEAVEGSLNFAVTNTIGSFLILTGYNTSYTPRKVQVGARVEF